MMLIHTCSIIVDKIDKNGDGSVTENELKDWVRHVGRRSVVCLVYMYVSRVCTHMCLHVCVSCVYTYVAGLTLALHVDTFLMMWTVIGVTMIRIMMVSLLWTSIRKLLMESLRVSLDVVAK